MLPLTLTLEVRRYLVPLVIVRIASTYRIDLQFVSDMLVQRLGPDFARSAIGNRDNYVSPRVRILSQCYASYALTRSRLFGTSLRELPLQCGWTNTSQVSQKRITSSGDPTSRL